MKRLRYQKIGVDAMIVLSLRLGPIQRKSFLSVNNLPPLHPTNCEPCRFGDDSVVTGRVHPAHDKPATLDTTGRSTRTPSNY